MNGVARSFTFNRQPIPPIKIKQVQKLRLEGHTQTAIAKKNGITQAKVSQILKAA